MHFCIIARVCGLCVVVVVGHWTGYRVWLVCVSLFCDNSSVQVRPCGVFANRQLKVDTGCAALMVALKVLVSLY